jgi:hypothetical protein
MHTPVSKTNLKKNWKTESKAPGLHSNPNLIVVSLVTQHNSIFTKHVVTAIIQVACDPIINERL